jgi:hypothetical protein
MEPFSLLLLAGMKTSDVLFYVEPQLLQIAASIRNQVHKAYTADLA